ncbi:hypothetical protein G9Q38_02090 [Pusillimonas sp. DMV24BSW_D]|uniref:hypothetical protein n=1 Tax=Neopusillimonas aestuarii TaxID=2716226 RepID=UPI00140D50EF|nr:hypothetical protein [Pusillimonas sp. DMV24BSW_D]QIM48053.1 hypothetical protein G9Q38_02090 [Pusillimonas sp. DMV24BSW_D]
MIVHRFMFHPVCLRDGGSLELAGWREKLDLDTMDWRKYQLFSVRDDDALRLNSFPGFRTYADGLDVVYFRSSD